MRVAAIFANKYVFIHKMGRKHFEFIYDYDDYTVVVYIDGACYNNGRPNAAAGLGVWFNYGHAL